MMKKVGLIVSVVCMLIAGQMGVGRAQRVTWETVSGPYGGVVANIGLLGSTLVAESANGRLFISQDSGLTWLERPAVTPGLIGVVRSDLISASVTGIYVSSDTGRSWQGPYPGNSFASLLYFSDSVSFATIAGAMYRSMKFSDEWSYVGNGLCCVEAATVAGRNVYFANGGGDSTGGIYRSRDNGSSVVRIDTNFGHHQVTCLKFIGLDLYAVAEQHLYRSLDSGVTWMIDTVGLGSPSVNTVYGSLNGLLAATARGVYRSVDGGASWSFVTGTDNYLNITSIIAMGPRLLAATSDGVMSSTDGGMTWQLHQAGFLGLSIDALKVHGDLILAESYPYIYTSTDRGDSWRSFPMPPTHFSYDRALTVGERQSKPAMVIYLGATEGLYSSLDSGKSWLLSTSITNVEVIVASTSGLIARTDRAALRSRDFGRSWDTIAIRPIDSLIHDITTSGDKIFYMEHDGRCAYSSDFGNSWYYSRIPNPSSIEVASLTDSAIYLSYSLGGDLRSRDHGMTWEPVVATEDCRYFTQAGSTTGGNWILAGASTGVAASTDGLHFLTTKLVASSNSLFQLAVNDKDAYSAFIDHVYRTSLATLRVAAEPEPSGCVVFVSPDPTQGLTKFQFVLTAPERVTLLLYSATGRVVGELYHDQMLSAGMHRVSFDGSALPSGSYSYRLLGAGLNSTGHFTIVK